MIPDQVLDWAHRCLGRDIVAVESLRGRLTDTMYALHAPHGSPVILRHIDIARWGETGRQHVISEATGCRLMTSSPLPTPLSLASETEGSQAGAYVGLTIWLPGQVRFDALGPEAINALAEAAVVIHRTAMPLDPVRTTSGCRVAPRCPDGAPAPTCGGGPSPSLTPVHHRLDRC